MFHWWRRRRREKILEASFPQAWREIIQRRVGYSRYLDAGETQYLEDLVQVFVAEKKFQGCGGLELNDDVRVTIAANACILLLGLDHDLFSGVESILVYPTVVRRPVRERSLMDPTVSLVEEAPLLLGEAHLHGPVILVWDAVRQGSGHPTLGHNVVFHEFAHKLDMLDDDVDGTPPLDSRKQYERWSKACGDVYFNLQKQVGAGALTFLDPYAATSEAEFFAVATEFFFERAFELRAEHPNLYGVLREFYRQNPAARFNTGLAR